MRYETNQSGDSHMESAGVSPQQQFQAHVPLNDTRQNNSSQGKRLPSRKLGPLGYVFFAFSFLSSALGFYLLFKTGNVFMLVALNAPLLTIISTYFQSRFRD